MERAPFQVLIFPFHHNRGKNFEYAIFRRNESTGGYWQGIAGGGEKGETVFEAAKREAWEEAGIPNDSRFIVLDSVATIPVEGVVGGFLWGEEVYVIPEHCFGVEVKNRVIHLSKEHAEYKWVSYKEAIEMLKWDNNKNALWELHQRLQRSIERDSTQS